VGEGEEKEEEWRRGRRRGRRRLGLLGERREEESDI
jgi:hypothetical protein